MYEYLKNMVNALYMRDFTIENFTISKVLENLPVPRYKLKEYNGDDIVGKFF